MIRHPETFTLAGYEPTQIVIECRRCNKHRSYSTGSLKAKYGNPTLMELARLVAATGCALAASEAIPNPCKARPVEPPVHHWAELDHARRGGWWAVLHCRRRFAGLKATDSCPELTYLNVETLAAVLGYDFKLENLPGRISCPHCGTKLIEVEWLVPEEPPNAGGTTADPAPPLRMRRQGATLARRDLAVFEGGGKKRRRSD
jgi:hypothetical protein